MSLGYVQVQLSMSLAMMASSAKPFSKRLLSAYRSYLFKLQDSDFPEDVRPLFRRLNEEIRESIHHIGDYSYLNLSPQRAKKCIELIGSIEFGIITAIKFPDPSPC
ncbi:hypothetical protein [Alsobacter sp. SYSU BS001988]